MHSLWQSALESISSRMSARNFELWISPLRYISFIGDTLTLAAPNPYLKEWFEDNYLPLFQKELVLLAGQPVDLVIVVNEPEPSRVTVLPSRTL